MARIRTIKPEFWTSEQIVECSMSARLLFIGLWNFCDDNGAHPYSPKTIKMEIFPGDEIKLSALEGWISELIKHGLLKTYHIEDKRYLQVTGWHHQKIDKPNPKHPIPLSFDDDSTNSQRGIDDQSPAEGKGRESKGREENYASPDGSPNALSDFELFWKEYPKHTYKKTAYAEWCKHKSKPPIETIMSALNKQKRAKEQLRQTGQFVSEWPDPQRWIKGDRWNDEITTETAKPPTPQAQTSPYEKCPSCGAEVLRGDFIEEGGKKRCLKCPVNRELAKDRLSNLIGGMLKSIPEVHA